MLFQAFRFLSLLGGIRRVSGLAVWGRHHQNENTTSSIDKREEEEEEVIVTKFSTIYYKGDSSKPRTAEPGYNIQVDLSHGFFGFCPTTVTDATDCGLAGVCIDRYSCSEGCGWSGDSVTTVTCSNSRAAHCSFAFLTLTNDYGPFAYVACGPTAAVDHYLAFATTATTTTTTSTSAEIPSSSTLPPTSSTPTSTSTGSQQAVSNTFAPPTTNTRPPSSRATPSSNNSSSNNHNTVSRNPDNTPAIIGGVFGCLALVCACAILLFWMRLRSRTAAAAAAAAAAASATAASGVAESAAPAGGRRGGGGRIVVEQKHAPLPKPVYPPPPVYKAVPKVGTREMPAELPGRGLSVYGRPGGGVGAGYRPMTPVELPASPGRLNRSSRVMR